VLRNAVLLAILAPRALIFALPALGLMFITCISLSWLRRQPENVKSSEAAVVGLQSPFSLRSAIQFGGFFLGLQIVGSLAQQWLGQYGFYAVTFVGGFISSASSAASAGSLAANGTIPDHVAGTGAVIASLTSVFVNMPLVARIAHERPLTRRIAVALTFVMVVGSLGAIAESYWMSSFNR
jgi:uncharacterized membrane protein (DUF4010 family)